VWPILWHSEKLNSTEFFRLKDAGDGYWLSGTVIARLEGKPAKIEYLIKCDAAWRTREAAIVQDWDGEARSLSLTVNDAGRWTSRIGEYPDLTGITDIDLSITPSTNLLPLKRHYMNDGDSLETTAAWVHFPSLQLAVLPQKYTRLSMTEYAYEAPTLGYSGVVTFDADGICVTYGELWKQV
jgi:uncharacterized protein